MEGPRNYTSRGVRPTAADIEKEVADLRRENDRLTRELETADNMLAAAKVTNDTLAEEILAFKVQIDQWQADNLALTNTVTKREQELLAAKHMAEEGLRTLADVRAERDALKNENRTLKDELLSMKRGNVFERVWRALKG